MLTVTFRNDGTGDHEVANYDVSVAVNGLVLERGRVEGHRRAEGWRGLLLDFVSACCAEGVRPCCGEGR